VVQLLTSYTRLAGDRIMDRVTWTTVLPAPSCPDETEPSRVIANHISGESVVVP